MKEKWTGHLVGKMHNNDVSYEQLAKHLGVTKAYVGMVLNCKRTPPNAKERFETAVNEIINNKGEKE